MAVAAVVSSTAGATSTPPTALTPRAVPGLSNPFDLDAPSPAREVWSISIGTNTYANAEPLEVAVNDARAADQTAASLGATPGHRLLLTDGTATGQNIENALRTIALAAGPEDLVILTFSGHATRNRYGRHALRTTDGIDLLDTHLADLLQPLQATTWILAATCYAAGFDELLAPGRALVAAAADGEIAYENLDIGHSYLVEYLLNRHAGDLRNWTDPNTFTQVTASATRTLIHDHPDRGLTVMTRR